jgi:prolyl-tRNA editing enzyme YbaK/EbsC (Cys-tRNA(Pro) deacylase)
MSHTLKPSAQRVQDALTAQGFTNQVIELADSTRTSAEAAAAVGCTVGQIAKSLVFRGKRTRQPLLIIASGSNRVDEKQVAAHVGERPERADADFVRAASGFAIGGIPPLGHDEPIATYIDQDLLQYDLIWAAAGHPNAVFRLTPAELLEMTRGQVIPVARVQDGHAQDHAV